MDTNTEPNTSYQAALADGRQRRQKAFQMQREGMTLQQIGNHFGVSRQRAAKMISAAIKEQKVGAEE